MPLARLRHGTAAALASLCVASLVPDQALADYKVWTPDVQAGERALELVGDRQYQSRTAGDATRELNVEAEFGIANFWQTEAEIETARPSATAPGWRVDQLTWENLFAFTQRGESWVDAGWFAEWGHGVGGSNPSEFTTGPVLRKDFRSVSHAVNLFVQRVNGQPSASLLYAWEGRIDALTWKGARTWTLTPGWQWYANAGPLNHLQAWSRQDQRAGPQLFGKVFQLGHGALEWNAGILFALTSATPGVTVRWQLEYEMP